MTESGRSHTNMAESGRSHTHIQTWLSQGGHTHSHTLNMAGMVTRAFTHTHTRNLCCPLWWSVDSICGELCSLGACLGGPWMASQGCNRLSHCSKQRNLSPGPPQGVLIVGADRVGRWLPVGVFNIKQRGKHCFDGGIMPAECDIASIILVQINSAVSVCRNE